MSARVERSSDCLPRVASGWPPVWSEMRRQRRWVGRVAEETVAQAS